MGDSHSMPVLDPLCGRGPRPPLCPLRAQAAWTQACLGSSTPEGPAGSSREPEGGGEPAGGGGDCVRRGPIPGGLCVWERGSRPGEPRAGGENPWKAVSSSFPKRVGHVGGPHVLQGPTDPAHLTRSCPSNHSCCQLLLASQDKVQILPSDPIFAHLPAWPSCL